MIKKYRKSRFHDEKGNRISSDNLLKNGLKSFISAVARKIFNIYTIRPWISYTAANEIRNKLSDQSIILEYGAGYSTLWWSRRAAKVYSVEDNQIWYQQLKELIKKKNIKNIDLSYFEGPDFYNFMSDKNQKYDFIVIDGTDRDKCAMNAIKLIKKGGMIYYDNSDKGMHDHNTNNEYREAERILKDYATAKKAKIKYFTDFAPGSFLVQQGMLIML